MTPPLKSAYELALERMGSSSTEPTATLTEEQKAAIEEIRKEYRAKIAEREIMLQSDLRKLVERTPPEQLQAKREELKEHYRHELAELAAQLERKLDGVRAAAS